MKIVMFGTVVLSSSRYIGLAICLRIICLHTWLRIFENSDSRATFLPFINAEWSRLQMGEKKSDWKKYPSSWTKVVLQEHGPLLHVKVN